MRTIINSAFLLILLFAPTLSAQQQMTQDMRKLIIAESAINSLYVDNVNETKLVEDAIRGMLSKLDPHSDYMEPSEVKQLNEPLQGNFEGIGIQFNMLNDTLFVIQTIVGGPSERVGLLSGDRIITVDDTLIAGVKMVNTDIMRRLRGAKGTEVEIKVLRRGVPDLITFRIIRDKIPIVSLDASFMADKTTGYVRLSRFGATTHDEMVEAIKLLQSQGMKNLILDLQGNGGGYLSAAIEIADEFLTGDRLIVYTEGNKQQRDEAVSTENGIFKEGKLAVLIDESSASASEILSGAIQDWDRGVVIGRRSYGKGLVQRPIPLPDGSMIRLTVARYYTPTGRSIQKPYEDGKDAYALDLINRYNKGEMVTADSIHFPDSLKYNTLITKRTVYGGGGIMPDIFVPFDTTRYTDYHRDIVARGALNRFCMSYYDENQKELKKRFSSFTKFNTEFKVTEEMFNRLIQMGEQENITKNEEQFAKSKQLIGLQVKALIARDLFEMSEYFKVMNQDNESFLKAIEIINDNTKYNAILQGQKPKVN